jgi:hypothetical protein
MRKLTVNDLRQHVIRLWGGEDEIEWIARPGRAFALPGAGIICIPLIKGLISYATALHEIGIFMAVIRAVAA